MRVLVRSKTGKPFWRAGLCFPPVGGVEIDPETLPASQMDAILREPHLRCEVMDAQPVDGGPEQRPGGEQQQGPAAATGTAEGAAPDHAPAAPQDEPAAPEGATAESAPATTRARQRR